MKYRLCPECTGKCGKDVICPWETWEYGPNHDYIPMPQDIAEGADPKARLDTCAYEVRTPKWTTELKHIDEVIRDVETLYDFDVVNIGTGRTILSQHTEPMFRYRIFLGDYSLAGFEWLLEYDGADRKKAMAAFKDAKEWLGCAMADITVLGREKKKFEDKGKKMEEEMAATWEERAANDGPDILEYEDGTLAFDDGTLEDYERYEAEHGDICKKYPYRDYFYSRGIFADRHVSAQVELMKL